LKKRRLALEDPDDGLPLATPDQSTLDEGGGQG
jgi:hypothetical protein